MIKICEQCKITYDAKRSDSRFHNAYCRLTWFRKHPLSVSTETDNLSVSKPAWQKVMDGELSGIDIGYGPNDYTRKMVEERVKSGDTFKPNWFTQGYKSKNHVYETSRI